MFGDVNATIEDGNLGRSSVSGTGKQFKIGITDIESTAPILITGNMSAKKIQEKLGNSPLADACIDSVEWGAKEIHCLPVKADIQATIGTIEQEGSGSGQVTITGSPVNELNIVIEITKSGETNEGEFRYSIDGGYRYSEELTLPLSGEFLIPETGLKAGFIAADNETFIKGDCYRIKTTAPEMSNQVLLDMVLKLINIKTDCEFVHIVGITSKPLWASLITLANEFLTKYKRPMFFVCEGRNKTDEETMDEYIQTMEDEVKGINSLYLQVVLSFSQYQRIDGRVQNINNAGIITGLYCQAKQSQSIGEVKAFPIPSSKMKKLLPEEIEDYLERLDSFRYLTIRQYMGKEDFYVTNANMLSAVGSDFAYAEDVRVLNRLVKEVRSQALENLHMEIDPVSVESSIAVLEEELNTPIEKAKREKIISSGRVSINTEDLNILADENIDLRITYVPMGHIRSMTAVFAVENPYTSE